MTRVSLAKKRSGVTRFRPAAALLMDKIADQFTQSESGPPPGALRLIRAFRSDVLLAFGPHCYTDLRVFFRQLGHRFVYLNDPQDIECVLNTHMHCYQPNVLARRLLEPIVGRGLIFAEGADWRRQHGQLAPFFQPRNIERFIESFHETAKHSIACWSTGGTIERNLLLDFRKLTIAVIARSLLSVDDENRTAQLADFAARAEGSGALLAWQDYVALFAGIDVGQPPQRREFSAQWRAWVESLVNRRQPIEDPKRARDMLDVLLTERDDGSGEPPSRDEILDQVGTMLSSGFITTALALFWTVLGLAAHPSHQEAVRQELCQGDTNAPPDWTSLRSSSVALSFLYESLRLYPPVYIIAREARSDDAFGDFRVPRGAAVIIAPWVVHRHAKHWREPNRFDPTRFLVGGRVVTPQAWMPFGVGPRVCIASTFATMEILVVLRSLLARFNIELRGPVPRPVGRVTLTPSFQPQFHLTPL